MSQILQFSAIDYCDTLKLHELDNKAIAALPISSYQLPDGTYQVISIYSNDVWRLEDARFPSNKSDNQKKIRFNTIPAQFVDAVKFALKHYDIENKPAGASLVNFFTNLKPFLHYLDRVGVKSTAPIMPLHCSNYVHETKQEISKQTKKPLSESTLGNRFWAVETLYTHLKGTQWAFEHPWVDSSAYFLAGTTGQGKKTGKTPIIIDDELQKLVQYCDAILDKAKELLTINKKLDQVSQAYAEYSTFKINKEQNKALKANGYNAGLNDFRKEINRIPMAAAIIILTFSGIRNHEFAAIQSDAYRIQDEEDEIYYWLKSHSSKTHEGYTEWLVPEIVIKAINVQKAYVEPLRQQLLNEQQERLTTDPHDPRGLKIDTFKDHLFLTKDTNAGNQINAMTDNAFDEALKTLGKALGIKDLASHRFRRTFAVYVARNALGDLRYLKKHFKHWSMDMTLLYAFNEEQDIELYDEIGTQIKSYKIERVAEFLEEDTILTGGVGNRLMSLRTNSEMVETFESRADMAEKISSTVHLRSTGHSWCTSDVSGCGGKSVIEGTRCVDCDDSIIERERHGAYFKGVYIQQLELRQIKDIGEAGKQRVERDIERCKRVLKDLGLWNEVQESVI